MKKEVIDAIGAALQAASRWKLAAPVSPGDFNGRRTGRRPGGSTEFSDYRAYRAGDEPRRVDWRLFARNDQLMIRQFAREADPRCDILLDCSSSMGLYGKDAAAAGVAALLARSAVNAGFSLHLWALHEKALKIERAPEPLEWELPLSDSAANPPEVLPPAVPGFFRRGLRLFISDLLFEAAPGTIMEHFGENTTAVIQILAREELSPGLSGVVALTDPETGEVKNLNLSPRTVECYRRNLEQLQRAWEETLRFNRGFFFPVDADDLRGNWAAECFCRGGLLQ